MRLPHLGSMRRFAQLLTADALAAAGAGDAGHAAADLRSLLAISRHASEGGILISDLVGRAVLDLHNDLLMHLLREHPDLLADEQLVDLSHRLAATLDAPPDLSGERAFFDDFLQRVYSDDGDGNGHVTNEGIRFLSVSNGSHVFDPVADVAPIHERAANVLFGPFSTVAFPDRASIRRAFDRILDHGRALRHKPMWTWTEDDWIDPTREIENRPLGEQRYAIVLMLAPAFRKVAHSHQRSIQIRDATLTAIALELHRRRAGRYPASLDELVPALLPAVPPDRFDGRPLKYRLAHDGPVLYSVGHDRDDDNATPPDPALPYAPSVMNWRPPPDGPPAPDQDDPTIVDADWILWPTPDVQ